MILVRFPFRHLVLVLSLALITNSPAQSSKAPTRHHSSTSTHKKSTSQTNAKKSDPDEDAPSKSDSQTAASKKFTSTTTAPKKTEPSSGDAQSKPTPKKTSLQGPVVATIDSSEIAGFSDDSPAVQKLITDALALTEKNLGYLYGSADPSEPGMDCSGTIYYLLQKQGMKDVPRSSDEQYVWARKAGTFRAVESSQQDSFEFNELKPGDLLFWEGTYSIKRDIPITHSMIYLGEAKSDGLKLMVGASDGRSYRGQKCYGVSVFEFKMPPAGSKSRFVGYARIPGLWSSSLKP
ncbi:hypothetical protein BH09VER1_BH09VER1_21440 [soil metagenome]